MKALLFVFVFLFSSQNLYSQTSQLVHEKAPRLKFEDLKFDRNYPHNPKPMSFPPDAVLIGKMWNAYSTEASYTNQIFTDTFSGLICVVHRGSRKFLTSGMIVYRVSDDGGANWTPEIGPMNLPGSAGRHPNISLSNPTKDITPGKQSVVASFPVITTSWQYLEFSSDSTVGCSCFNHYLDSTYYPNDEMFINSKGDIFTVAPKIKYQVVGADTINMDLFISTNKGVTWTKRRIAKTSDFEQNTWNGTKGFINKKGIGYIMVQGKKPGQNFYSFGYKKTTDDGVTWDENWTWVNPYTIPALSGKVHALNYEVDAITDIYGILHFAGTFVDTVDKGTSGNTGIYHLWGEGTSWNAGLVRKVLKTSFSLPGGLSTLNECEFTSSSGYGLPSIALKWIDLPTANDSLPDILFAEINYPFPPYYYIRNLTKTPNIKEKYSQMSAWSYTLGFGGRADIMYTIFGAGDTNDLAEAELWYLRGVYFGIVDYAEEDFYPPIRFHLSQNFPNPFNNQTRLEYFVTYEFKGNVVIKVYDVLGKEIATLVDEHKKEGLHTVTFNESDYGILASGVYIFELKANNTIKRVKGVLLR
jgi:hypothetical protein